MTKLKVLLVHNHYGSEAPSGENRVFALERELLSSRGHEVLTFERYSDTIRSRGFAGLLTGAVSTPWNVSSAREVRKLLDEHKPDVVHAHNTFPLISPSIFQAASGRARVLTVHNFRLFCAAAIPMRAGNVCTICMDQRSIIPALKHGCYRNSRAATLPLALGIAINRRRHTWERDVEAFIALTDFQRQILVDAGLPAEKTAVKPNFFPGKPVSIPYSARPNSAVYVGRLSAEKGVADLIEAWRIWGKSAPQLRIVGDGPLRDQLHAQCAATPNITVLGKLDHDAAIHEIANARLLVLPSRWYETFGMSIVEAYAYGTPVAVSSIGSLPALAAQSNGIVFRPGDPENLYSSISVVWSDTKAMGRMSNSALQAFADRYSEDTNYSKLIRIYEQAIERT